MRAVMQAEMRVRRWPPQCVRESVLPSCLLVVRTARGDRGSVRQCIKRVCGRGYCSIPPMERGLAMARQWRLRWPWTGWGMPCRGVLSARNPPIPTHVLRHTAA